MYRCYNSCPCILPPILLFRLSLSVIPIGVSWFKTTPPLPLSFFRFFSLFSLRICLFQSAPIVRFHTILVLFSFLFFRSFCFELPFLVFFWSETTIVVTCFFYFSHNHKKLVLLFLSQRNYVIYTSIFFFYFSFIACTLALLHLERH